MTPPAAGQIDAGIRRVAAAVQADVIGRLGIEPQAVDPRFAEARGSARGRDFVLRTQQYAGGPVERATTGVLAVDGGPAVGLVLAVLPRPTSGLPILGVDLLAHGPRLGLVVADLSPTDGELWTRAAAEHLVALHARIRPVGQPRKRPQFTEGTFSARMLVCAAQAGAEGQVLDAVAAFVSSAGGLMQAEWGAPGSPVAAERNHLWRLSMRENDKELDGFARLFGADWARAYLDDYLFPAS